MEQQDWTKKLTEKEQEELLKTLKERFEQNQARHERHKWEAVERVLQADPGKIQTVYAMEATGGEPDVIAFEVNPERIIFCDCSAETPAGRRKISYDQPAREKRKHGKPATSAKEMAAEMGIDLLSEAEYLILQKLGAFDLKTSSWIETPSEIREKGGALYGDRRYDRVFIYHNGAESWYSVRGFRGRVIVK